MVRLVLALLLGIGCNYTAPQAAGGDGDPDSPPPSGDGLGVDAPAGPKVRHLDIVGSKVTGGPHADFPLLVSVTRDFLRSTGSGGDVASAQGFDITFSSDLAGAVPLAHEIERYVATTGELVAWVKVPTLTSTSTIFLHYSDPSITTSRENRAGVWSAGYAGVWHLSDVSDSKTAAAAGVVNSAAVGGKIADAHSFDGSTSVLTIAATGANADVFVGGGSSEAWFFATSAGEASFGRVMEKGDLISFGMGDGNAIGSFRFGYVFSNGAGNWRTPANTVTLNTWTHGAIVYDSSSAANLPQIYLNGVLQPIIAVTVPSGTPTSDASSNLAIGDRESGARAFEGSIDEARWAHAVRSAGWIATEFANQSDPGAFLTVGEP